jgi:hypothetical protein
VFSEVGNGGVETKIMKISHSYLEIFAILQRMRVVAMGYPATIFANACNSEMHHGRILILVSTPPFSDP